MNHNQISVITKGMLSQSYISNYVRLVVTIILLINFKLSFSQDSPDYSFEFIDNKIVVLEYNSVYDVHVSPDTVNYPNQRIQPGGFDNNTILSDLTSIVNPKSYDFVLLYSLHEIPGWINSGPRYSYPAKNIGRRNDMTFNHWGPIEWENLKSVPHMNSIEFLFRTAPDRPRYGSSLTIFHEMDHYWGVFINDQPIGPREWTSANPVAWLASGSSHWSWVWVKEDMPGMMYSGATSNKFNEFDLYFMGLMNYDEIKNVTYEVYEYMPETCGNDFVRGCQPTHEINIDSIIYAISLKGSEYYEGNGQRIPATDSSIQNLKILNVIVKGKDEILSNSLKDSVLNILNYIPQDWEVATWNRSKMNITIDTCYWQRSNTQLNSTICEGDSINVGNFYYSESGTYTINLTNKNGCDSLVTLNLSVNPKYNIAIDTTICENDLPFAWMGKEYEMSGLISDTLISTSGCDSIVALELTINPSPVVSLGNDTTIYSNDSLFLDAGDGYRLYEWNTGEKMQIIKIDKSYAIGTHYFSVVVIDNYNCIATDTIKITIETPTNIVSVSEEKGLLMLYPNPTDGQVNISFENLNEKTKIYIYSESGTCVFYKQYKPVGIKTIEKLDLSEYPSGIYFIKVVYDNQISTNKLILKN